MRDERAAEAAERDSLRERIWKLDKMQTHPFGRVCPLNPEHGRLTADWAGNLACCHPDHGRGTPYLEAGILDEELFADSLAKAVPVEVPATDIVIPMDGGEDFDGSVEPL